LFSPWGLKQRYPMARRQKLGRFLCDAASIPGGGDFRRGGKADSAGYLGAVSVTRCATAPIPDGDGIWVFSRVILRVGRVSCMAVTGAV